MFHFMAGTFAGFAAFFGSFMGGHLHMASSTPPEARSEFASTTDRTMGDLSHVGSTTPWTTGQGLRGVIGIVSVVNGTTLTVLVPNAGNTATTTYSVDASSAKILKGTPPAAASIADIAVGDKVIVQGTVTGTAVVAKNIVDGLPPRTMPARSKGKSGMMGSTTQKMHAVKLPGGVSAQEEGSESRSEASSEVGR